jgi:hypothetical protein
MKIFKPSQKIICIYCNEKSQYPSSYYVVTGSTKHTEEICEHCDEKFLIRNREDGTIIVTSNYEDKTIYS